MSALNAAAFDTSAPGHDAARRIVCREHFRVLYQRNPGDQDRTVHAVSRVFRAARARFGSEHVKIDQQPAKGAPTFDFPVLQRDERVVSSLAVSEALNHLPAASFGYVFVSPEKRAAAHAWLDDNREELLTGFDGDHADE